MRVTPDATSPSGQPPRGGCRSVSLDLPRELHEAVRRLAAEQQRSEHDVLVQLLSEAIARRTLDGRQPERPASSPPGTRQPPAARAAWRAEAPATVDRAAGAHEWAENLLPTLPLRFQRYVAELLFDDERILFFLHRLPFRRRDRWWRSTEELEGLLVITDRMVLMIEDSVPPGPMFVAWGYAAWITAVERIAFARVTEAREACVLHVRCRAASGVEDRRFYFDVAQRADLLEAAGLLNRYAAVGDGLPARTYADEPPAWELPERRRAAPGIPGRRLDEPPEQELAVAQAAAGRVQMSLQGDRLEVRRDGIAQEFTGAQISSISIWRGVKGCALDWHVPGDRKGRHVSVVFQYPQSSPFLRIASRLRHVMGRPVASCHGPAAS